MGAVTDDRVLVAVDGGGSKTDAYAVASDGSILATARAGGSSPQILGLQPAVEVVNDVLSRLMAQLPGRRVDRLHAYLSGIDLPEEVAAFRAAVLGSPWLPADADAFVVDNDTFALLRAGTDAPDAVAVVCGTGMNTVGVRRDGATVRFVALGTISGDWGGGWSIGESALWYAARAADGRGEPTSLVDDLPRAFGERDVDGVIRGLHFGTIDSNTLSVLAPTVLKASRAGDRVAMQLVDRQAEEIVACAAAALRRLELLSSDAPVVLGGGVIAAGDEHLLDGVRAGLRAAAPSARIELVVEPPVLGALLLTLEAAGCGASALRQVVAEFDSDHRPAELAS
ncbi:BadF/BadG/BcrA/BcrD ATPase family protein [Humibacter soli]